MSAIGVIKPVRPAKAFISVTNRGRAIPKLRRSRIEPSDNPVGRPDRIRSHWEELNEIGFVTQIEKVRSGWHLLCHGDTYDGEAVHTIPHSGLNGRDYRCW